MQTTKPTQKTTNLRNTLWSVIKIIFGVLLIVFVLSKTNLNELTALATQVSRGWLILTVILFILLSFLKAYQYYILFDADLPYRKIFSVVILQNALSNFVATGVGIVTYLTVLQAEHGVKVSRSASVFIITKIGDVIAVWVSLIISLLFVWQQVSKVHNLILFLITIIGLGLILVGLAILLRHKFVKTVSNILERTGLLKFTPIQRLLGLVNNLVEFEQKDIIRILLLASGLSSMYLALTFMWTYSSLHTFNLLVTIYEVVFVSSLLQLVSIIPIQVFGGIGVSEAASLYLFMLFSFPETQLVAVLVGFRILFYATNLIVLLYLPLQSLILNRLAKKQ